MPAPLVQISASWKQGPVERSINFIDDYDLHKPGSQLIPNV